MLTVETNSTLTEVNVSWNSTGDLWVVSKIVVGSIDSSKNK